MIKNERQYRMTKARLREFERALGAYEPELPSQPDVHPRLIAAQRDALRSQLDDLRSQVTEYEALRDGTIAEVPFESWEELPRRLIQARIAAGLSQKQLADRLGMPEQQVQRYESTGYVSASWDRLLEVIHALGVKVRDTLLFAARETSVESILSRLEEIGVSRQLLVNRVLPSGTAQQLQGTVEDAGLVSQIAGFASRVFGVDASALLAGEPVSADFASAGGVRHKAPTNAEERRLAAYTLYAHYLALLVADATEHLPKLRLPIEPRQMREQVTDTRGVIRLERLIGYFWSLGVAVLPLRDHGTFHGAFWRINGRNVIIVKQRTRSIARWLFDLLHEARHAGEEPHSTSRTVVESPEDTAAADDEEQLCGLFAGDVLLDSRAEDLAQMCVVETGKNLRYLKRAVQRVAAREEVPVDALANYMAFRLSLQGENWWGAAHNLQQLSADPWFVVRDAALEHLDFGKLNERDRELLVRALSDAEDA